MSDNNGVILISHGSSLPYGEETFTQIREKFIKRTGLKTEVGYMKVSTPTIAQAVQNMKKENIKRIIALPVFLAPGIHTNIDIPILLGLNPLETDPRCPDGNYPEGHYLKTAENVNYDGEIKLLNAIGPDDDLIKFIEKRITEKLAESELDDAKTGILLVSHGSRLKYNKEFISALHDKFKKITNYKSTYGFMELAEPNIPSAIKSLGEIDRLIVVPVFIAPGVHTTNDIPTILGLKKHTHKHEHHHHHHETTDFNGEILYAEPIKADDILIDILVKKIGEI